MGTGLQSFQERMRAIPAEVRANVGADLVRAGAEVAAAVGALAPRDSGELAASIAVTGPGQSTPAYSQPGGAMVVSSLAAAVTVGNSAVRYAHLVEYGTRRTAAKPFFWPAFRLTRDKAARIIKAGMRQAIRGQK